MNQTKIIVDTNSYFRLAQNIHPLLCQPFGDEKYTLYMHADLNAEFRCSPRLKNKFDWAAYPEYRKNRNRSLTISESNKKEIAETFDYMWEHVKEEFLGIRGKGPSFIDTKIIATAAVLNIRVVTDDQDMVELAELYGVHRISSLELLQLMFETNHINEEKLKQVVAQWQYDNDTPYPGWKDEFRQLFDQDPPEDERP